MIVPINIFGQSGAKSLLHMRYLSSKFAFQTIKSGKEAFVLLRASAQENRAKGGHSRKSNLSIFLVYREVLTSLQTSWVCFFSKYGRFLELFEILDFARLTHEISGFTRDNRLAEKTALRNQTC